MKRKPLYRILLPAMILLLALNATVSVGMLQNADTLDVLFGKGEQLIINLDSAQETTAQYYTAAYATQAEARAAAQRVAQQISDEGTVLLKNDGLLPLAAEQCVSPLGLGYFHPLYCGSGSTAISTLDKDVTTPREGLHAAFAQVNTQVEDAQQRAFDASAQLGANANLTATRPVDGTETAILYEFSTAVYQDTADSLAGTVGVVYIVRQSGENQDAHMGAYEDGTPHALALTQAEHAILDLAKERCTGVVVIISSASPMELACLEDDPGISAILWQGGAGSTGYASIGEILAGRVNPSGRLPFTFAADFRQDPTWVNQDDGSDRFTYANAFTTQLSQNDTTQNSAAPFHEYEEGIYIGYRYYETAHALGALSDYYSRENGVVYPFGYGLSYADFRQEIVHASTGTGGLKLSIKVTNLSDRYAGKEVVQLYVTPPYTQEDAAAGIEKSAVSLVAFAKTKLLAPGESQTLQLTIEPEDLASYCYTHDNGDGTVGCYTTTGGEYIISLRRDSHTVLDETTFTIPETAYLAGTLIRPSDKAAQSPLDSSGTAVVTDSANHEQMAATNRFDQLNQYMTDPNISHATILTRADWANTQPTAPTEEDRIASSTVVEWIAQSDVSTGMVALPQAEAYPLSGQANGLVLADLRAVDYDNPMWDKLLDQLTYDSPETYRQVLFEAAYQTGELPTLSKPRSSEKDGPQGLNQADVTGKNWITGVCGYPAAPVMSATWNEALLYDLGAAVGQEALLKGINGWYAPGLNILRSPFCGRASEYYSEDPLLAGCMGAQVVSGAGDNGLSCAIKHFCLMETEAHRGPNTCTWMTEQTLREIYLRPFEIVVKNARKTISYTTDNTSGELSQRVMRACDFIMASDSGVGTVWTAASSALLTDVLRGEWGFDGTVVSDIHMNGSATMIRRLLSAGCDMLMSLRDDHSINFDAYDEADGQVLIRRAIKNVCYTMVNSSLMQGISSTSVIEYRMSPWMQVLLTVSLVVAAILLLCTILCVVDLIYCKRHPDDPSTRQR